MSDDKTQALLGSIAKWFPDCERTDLYKNAQLLEILGPFLFFQRLNLALDKIGGPSPHNDDVVRNTLGMIADDFTGKSDAQKEILRAKAEQWFLTEGLYRLAQISSND